MEKPYHKSPLKAFLLLLRTAVISILGGALTGIIAALIGSLFNIER